MEWIFDPTPPSGARTGGDVAEYAFTPGIEVFVREVLQNAKDQHMPKSGAVSVLFRLIKLEGKPLEAFLSDIGWAALRPHVEAAGKTENGASYRQALERLDNTKELTLLLVEDRNTGGLIGPEIGNGNFAALCRDTLFSNKPDATAGGSYGLGKAVLWRFSSFSTVLFNSNLSKLETNQTNPRLIGRVSLPWHQSGKSEYSGGGWFGESILIKGGTNRRAESVWGGKASDLASKLGMSRSGSGTSILVVGFDEPANETRPLNELAQEIERAASIWFWPSITDKAPTLEVNIEVVENGRTVLSRTVTSHEAVKPFVEAMWRYQSKSLKALLEGPGDTIAIPINVRLPGRRDTDAPAFDAEATLVVQLSETESATTEDPNRNSVACFRGPGMIVEYRKLERLSLTARPFYALLICGNAQLDGATEANAYFDEFLRAAEPPEHNRWIPTKRLKDTYKIGYKKALDGLGESVRQKLREAISEKITGGKDGPQLLVRKFPIGSAGGGGGDSQPFEFRDLRATLNDSGAWEFSARAIARTNIDKGWIAVIDLRFADEGGGRGEGGVIGSLQSTAGKVSIDAGKAVVHLPSTVRQVTIDGTSDPALHPISARLSTVELVLNGKRK